MNLDPFGNFEDIDELISLNLPGTSVKPFFILVKIPFIVGFLDTTSTISASVRAFVNGLSTILADFAAAPAKTNPSISTPKNNRRCHNGIFSS